LRVSTWNIRSGGGKRIGAIADCLLNEGSDLCLLTEFRSKPGESLKSSLSLQYPHIIDTSPEPGHNGVLAYSSSPIMPLRCPAKESPASAHRWLPLHLVEQDIRVLGVHVPNPGERWNRMEFWDSLVAFATRNAKTRALIVGDLNTGLADDSEGMTFPQIERLQRLMSLGWVDAWRTVNGDRREYTWFNLNTGNGFRVDHCLLSPSLKKHLMDARFNHSVRENRLSDHSILTVELAL